MAQPVMAADAGKALGCFLVASGPARLHSTFGNNMSTTCKIIRFLGLLGAAGIVLNLVVAMAVSAQGGSGLTAG